MVIYKSVLYGILFDQQNEKKDKCAFYTGQ